MTYRLVYAPEVEAERGHLTPERRKRFDAGMAVIVADPYAHGSPVRGDRDRREVTVSNVAFARYVISASVVTVTVWALGKPPARAPLGRPPGDRRNGRDEARVMVPNPGRLRQNREMPSTSPPFELRLRRTRNNTKMIVMAIGVCALMFVSGVPLGPAIAGWALFGSAGLLAAAMPRIAPVALRMDAEGVAVSRGVRRPRRVAWADVEAVVSWQVRDGSHWVGVVATPEYRRRTGLDTRRGGRWMDNIIGLPIAWTTTKWDGPPDELKTMVAALWRISPDTPWIDAALHDRTAPT